MRTYEQRIDAIAEALGSANIPYNKVPCWEGFQLRFPWCDGYVACHDGTFGTTFDLVETYRFPWDRGSVSSVTTEQAVALIAIYFTSEEEMQK